MCVWRGIVQCYNTCFMCREWGRDERGREEKGMGEERRVGEERGQDRRGGDGRGEQILRNWLT